MTAIAWKLRQARRAARFYPRYYWQRVRRGWSDADLWGMHSYVCRQLGDQLVWLADNAHGYPSYLGTAEEWESDLRENGSALQYFGVHHDDLMYQVDAYDKALSEARAALAWVGEHLPDLWD